MEEGALALSEGPSAVPLQDGGEPGFDFLDDLVAPQRPGPRKRKASAATAPEDAVLVDDVRLGDGRGDAVGGDVEDLFAEMMTLCDGNPDEVAAFEGLMGIDCFMDSDCEEDDGNAADTGPAEAGLIPTTSEGAAVDDDLADTLSLDGPSAVLLDLHTFMARMQLRHSPGQGFPRDVFCSATDVILGR
eukprot:6382687-Heterocapsa_arctica.AAC.1